MLKVKFKIRTMEGVEKYGLKHDIKTFSFKIKCVDVHEGHSMYLYTLSLISSCVCNNLKHTTGMENWEFITVIWMDYCLLVAVPCFVLSCAVL